MKRLVGAPAVTLVLALVAGCSAPLDTGPFSDSEIAAAPVDNALAAPTGFVIYPAANYPRIGTLGSAPGVGTPAWQAEISLDDGQTWQPAFDSPLYLSWQDGSYSYGVSGTLELTAPEGVFEVRARWIGAGPVVSDWSDPVRVRSGDSVPPACDRAVRAAAEVPLAEVNDVEIAASLEKCDSMEDWLTALYLHPQLLGYDFSSLDAIDPASTAELVCFSSAGAAACVNGSLGVYSRESAPAG